MQYHSNEHSERYNEFCRVFWIAHHQSENLQLWSFDSTDDLKPYLDNISGLDVKTLLKDRSVSFQGVQLFLDSGASRKRSGFRGGNIFLPLTSVTEAFTKITEAPNSDTFYIPHSKAELDSYLKHFTKSNPL